MKASYCIHIEHRVKSFFVQDVYSPWWINTNTHSQSTTDLSATSRSRQLARWEKALLSTDCHPYSGLKQILLLKSGADPSSCAYCFCRDCPGKCFSLFPSYLQTICWTHNLVDPCAEIYFHAEIDVRGYVPEKSPCTIQYLTLED